MTYDLKQKIVESRTGWVKGQGADQVVLLVGDIEVYSDRTLLHDQSKFCVLIREKSDKGRAFDVSRRDYHLWLGDQKIFTNKARGHLWFNGEMQVNITLMRLDAHMNKMMQRCATHPLAIGSNGHPIAQVRLDGKVNERSKAEAHESIYNFKFCTVLGYNLTIGYSSCRDKEGMTHAWMAFGAGCSEDWQRKLSSDMLLNLAGFKCLYGSHRGALLPLCEEPGPVSSQPLAGAEEAGVHEDEDEDADAGEELLFARISATIQGALGMPMTPSPLHTAAPQETRNEQSDFSQPLELAEAASSSIGPPMGATTSQPLAGDNPRAQSDCPQSLAEAASTAIGPPMGATTSQLLVDADEMGTEYVGLDFRPVLGEDPEDDEDDQETLDRMGQVAQYGDYTVCDEIVFKK